MMLAWIRQFLAPPIFEGDEEKTRIARLSSVILQSAFVAALLITLVASLFDNAELRILLVGAITTILTLVLWIVMRSGHVQLASILFSFMLLVGTTAAVYFAGTIRAPITNIYILCFIAAGLLVGNRATIVFAVLSLLALLALTQAEIAGSLPDAQVSVGIAQWINYAVVFGMTVVLLGLATRSINEAFQRARGYAAELEDQRQRLEETVKERTRDVARRARYLEATALVAHDAAAVLQDPQQLLSRVVDLISEQFGFYHTGLFMVGSGGEWVELRAASSEGGRRMLARGHRLRVEAASIIGYVIERGESHIALDVGPNAVRFDDVDLSETRSEAVLPLQVRGEVIGALDVQSTEPEAFSDEDVAVLQTLADQIAMAISNARLFQQAQDSLGVERQVYGELSREAWSKLLHAQPDLGFLRDQHGLSPASDVWRPGMETALHTRETTLEKDAATLALPIKVRGHVIGVIDAHRPVDAGEWTAEGIALAETLADQLGVALDGARSYHETQRRAAREQLIGEVTAHIRAATNVEQAVQRAVHEMGRALGATELVARIGTKQDILPKQAQVKIEAPPQDEESPG